MAETTPQQAEQKPAANDLGIANACPFIPA